MSSNKHENALAIASISASTVLIIISLWHVTIGVWQWLEPAWLKMLFSALFAVLILRFNYFSFDYGLGEGAIISAFASVFVLICFPMPTSVLILAELAIGAQVFVALVQGERLYTDHKAVMGGRA